MTRPHVACRNSDRRARLKPFRPFPPMKMADMQVCCNKCSDEFVFTVAEQRLFQANGWPVPRPRCLPCALLRKQKKSKHRKGDCSETPLQSSSNALGTHGTNGSAADGAAAPRKRGKGGVPAGVCYNCGKPGHLGLDCLLPRSGGRAPSGGRKCYRCRQAGHLSFTCTLPDVRAERASGEQTE